MLLTLINSLLSVALAGELVGAMRVAGQSELRMTAGAPSVWDFNFKDSETGQSPHHYHVMHQKPMHLVVISEDLSSFAHIHPQHFPHTSKPFRITVNTSVNDPDNFQLPQAVPFSGKFFLFSEIMPMDYGMLLFRFNLVADGAPRQSVLLQVDPVGPDGRITKMFDVNGEPTEDLSRARYRAKLQVFKVDHCNTVFPQLIIEFESKTEEKMEFSQLGNLDAWLDSYGHAIVIGSRGATAEEKIIQHLHATWPLMTGDPQNEERGPLVELTAHSHGQSTPSDIYKTWIQIKHEGRVLTLPFVFDWVLEGNPQKILFCAR